MLPIDAHLPFNRSPAIARKKSTMAERGIEMSDNGTISIYVRDPERMTDGFRSLLTQSSQEAVLEALNKAVAICNKSGMGLSYFSISNIKQKAG